ncbi:MAG: hypothetical protein LBD07_00905 [Spirochaetaceae bacterium]|jgi:glycerophosphoryl diester phosphodiesterase|nr:hypothetical protein [Spirochaetaceae bacterium]
MNTYKHGKLIAHRGLAGNYFENTLESFVAAGERDEFFGIETDVYWTADNEFVCVHDDAPFAGSEKPVFEMTFSEARSLILKPSVNYPYIHGTKNIIPSFKEYLEVCKRFKKTAVIELKQKGWTEDRIVHLSGLIKMFDMLDRSIIISFQDDAIEKSRKIFPKTVDVQQLIDKESLRTNKEYLDSGYSLDIGDLHSPTSETSGVEIEKELVDYAHKKGLFINVWSVDEEKRAKELDEIGVDYITTNFIL